MIQMIRDKSHFLFRDKAGKEHFHAQLIADTAQELAGVTGQGSVVWDFGSTAFTADGKVLMLDSSGAWHDFSDGSKVKVSGND